MQLAKRIPEPWGSFLEELDQRASGETRLDCLGGFVVTQLYGFSRETSDLDVLVVAPGKERTPLLESGRQGGELHRKYKGLFGLCGRGQGPGGLRRAADGNVSGGVRASSLMRVGPVRSGAIQAGAQHSAGPR